MDRSIGDFVEAKGNSISVMIFPTEEWFTLDEVITKLVSKTKSLGGEKKNKTKFTCINRDTEA